MKRFFLFCFAILCFAVLSQSETPRPTIKASDVVFMYSANPPSLYDDYQGTVCGWSGRAHSRDPKDVESFKKTVDEVKKRGMRFCGSIDFLVDFAGYIDFAPQTFMDAVCRNLEGNPLQVPWLWDHKHKGNPPYWFCFNNPNFQKYLLDQAERACLAPIDGLHIDDYSGTSACSDYNGGCFCPFCMEGFRGYLKDRFSKDQIEQWGIENIDSFHYGEYLKAKGFTATDFSRKREGDPLRKHFQDFQNEKMKERISAVYEHAEKIRGIPLVRSVNSSASSPRTILPSPIIDYFCGETDHAASSQRVLNDPIFIYRMVETLGDRQSATASGQDWAWIKANEKPGLIRTWIAQAYAYGSVFMAPHRQWCYTQELGTHWWSGKTEDFAYIYRFVRANAALLDDYVSLANLAVLCADSDFYPMKKAAIALAESNIPFDLLYTPEPDKSPVNTTSAQSYKTIVVSGETKSKANWLTNAKADLIEWKDANALPPDMQKIIQVEGSEKIRVSARYNPTKPDAPIVFHLLNQDYRSESDSIQPAAITVTIAKSLLLKANKTDFQQAVLHEIQKDIQTVAVKTTDSTISFSVDHLGLWAIVELK